MVEPPAGPPHAEPSSPPPAAPEPPAGPSRPRPLRLLALVALALAIGGALVVAVSLYDRAQQQRQAPLHLRSFVGHQGLFREDDKDGDGVLDYAASIEELGYGYMGRDYNGYRYEVRAGPNPLFEWSAEAIPTQGRGVLATSGLLPYTRYYFVDETGLVRVEEGRRATRESPLLPPEPRD
jgi:hypothetical protein